MADISTLIKQLESFHTRSQAMDELRHLGQAAVPTLIKALDHHAEGVRWAAVRLLGEIGDPSAISSLSRLTKELTIGFQAEEAIESIKAQQDQTVSEDSATTSADATTAAGLTDEELMDKVVEGTSWQSSPSSDGWTVQVSLPEGRKQSVRCIFHSQTDKRSGLGIVYTECGPADPRLYEWALKLNLRMPFGAFALRESGGQNFFVMVNSFLRETVTPLDIQKSISRIAKEADALEKQLTGGKDSN